MKTPTDIIELRIQQLRDQGMDAIAIREEIGSKELVDAWLFNADKDQAHRIMNLVCEASAMQMDQEDMEKALELSAAGWEAQEPDRPPCGSTFWHQTRVMAWRWRRPARTKSRPGRLYHSTQQAYNAMRRENQ